MANKYSEAKGILLNNGSQQLLPVSKAQLIELANANKTKFTGYDVNNATSVEDALTYLLNKGNSDLEAAKTYTGTSINGLNSTITAENGYVFGSITETAGKLTSYNQIWLDASVVSYQSENANINTVKDVIENIQKNLSAAVGDGGSVSQQINTALDNLDLARVSEAGKAIVSVSQENGQVAAAVGNIDAQYVNVDNTTLQWDTNNDGTVESDLTVQSAIAYLDSQITTLETGAARYTLATVSESVPANVQTRYQLTQTVNGTSARVGDYIDIPKDKSLVSVQLGHIDDTLTGEDSTTHESTSSTIKSGTGADALVFVHQLANGNYKLTTVNVSSFLTENEFRDGLQVNNGVVSVKVTDADNFLSVDATNGVKLSGVQSAINTAKQTAKTYADGLIEGLDSEIAAKTENNFSYVMTGVTETNGKLTAATYIGLTDENVKTTTFDSDSDLYKLFDSANLPTNLHDALNKIAGVISSNGGDAVTSVTGDDDNTYVKISATKSSNNVTLTVDDSALGNVAKLHYDDLGSVEVASIFNSNPEV